VGLLVRRLTSGRGAPVGDHPATQWICASSAAPEAANQGLWYFASQIASSEVKLHRALADDEYACALVERYVDNLGNMVAAWRNREQHEPGQP
jgi:hypothetical protein